VVVAGACYLSMALEAASRTFGAGSYQVEDVKFTRALLLREREARAVQLVLGPEGEEGALFQVFSSEIRDDGDRSWTLHAQGRIRRGVALDASSVPPLGETRARCHRDLDGAAYYQEFYAPRAFTLGSRFRCLDQVWVGDRECAARLRPAEPAQEEEGHHPLGPGVLDSCFQLFMAGLPEGVYVPIELKSLQYHGRRRTPLWCESRLHDAEDGTRGEVFLGDVRAYDESGEIVAVALGLKLKRVDVAALLRAAGIQPDEDLYEVIFEPRPAGRSHPGRSVERDRWLIFSDNQGVGRRLAHQIEAAGGRCEIVFAHAGHGAVNDGEHRVVPEPEQISRLVRRLVDSHGPFGTTVYLWGLDAQPTDDVPSASLGSLYLSCVGSALRLVQELAKPGRAGGSRVWFVTRGAQLAGTALPAASVVQAGLWGLGRVVALEHAELWGGLIDLSPEGRVEDVQDLFLELWEREVHEEVALGDGGRRVGRLIRASAPPWASEPTPLPSDATYLVTGGLGGLGLGVAEHLVRRGARNLVLVGRSGASDAHRPRLRGLESAGARVHVAAVDVTRVQELEDLLRLVDRSMPPLRGIVHAAGVLDDGGLAQQDDARLATAMAPKVQGAWNLHLLTRECSLDFFVLLSSAASILGSAGQGNYAAANAAMDALARVRRAQGLPGLSINWGPWSERGMAAADGGRTMERLEARGLLPISSARGLEMLDALLEADRAQIAVMRVDWTRYLRQHASSHPLAFLEHVLDASTLRNVRDDVSLARVDASTLLREVRSSPTRQERVMLLRGYLHARAAAALKLNPAQLPVTRPLIQVGFDSLTAVELVQQIHRDLEVNISPASLLDGPSVDHLAESVALQFEAGAPPPGTATRAGARPRETSDEVGTSLPWQAASSDPWEEGVL